MEAGFLVMQKCIAYLRHAWSNAISSVSMEAIRCRCWLLTAPFLFRQLMTSSPERKNVSSHG